MTDKIYEYRDEHNWFIGKWEGFNSIAGIGNVSDEEHFYLNRLLTRLNPPTDNDVLSGYDVTIVRKQSDFQLFRFIVEIIKTETGRDLQVLQHQGAILVTENDKLLLVHLPQAGVSTADFFGQDKGLASVGDTILIATKNEGKTKEFRKFLSVLATRSRTSTIILTCQM